MAYNRLGARELMVTGGAVDGLSQLTAALLRGPRLRREQELKAQQQDREEARNALHDTIQQRRLDMEVERNTRSNSDADDAHNARLAESGIIDPSLYRGKADPYVTRAQMIADKNKLSLDDLRSKNTNASFDRRVKIARDTGQFQQEPGEDMTNLEILSREAQLGEEDRKRKEDLDQSLIDYRRRYGDIDASKIIPGVLDKNLEDAVKREAMAKGILEKLPPAMGGGEQINDQAAYDSLVRKHYASAGYNPENLKPLGANNPMRIPLPSREEQLRMQDEADGAPPATTPAASDLRVTGPTTPGAVVNRGAPVADDVAAENVAMLPPAKISDWVKGLSAPDAKTREANLGTLRRWLTGVGLDGKPYPPAQAANLRRHAETILNARRDAAKQR
ncbi:hypothetical protein UFOVP141_50 [uncultured Caudovirales phage]|uniref:Uncharacterized protein n=1 Tax=uncultured Caudovirales phage TaxID=2100421 RepID=A0A6J7VMB0_9CAUD|nr:hypothetical protein UFOVP141_50 [uncultured Caudovirales phage]